MALFEAFLLLFISTARCVLFFLLQDSVTAARLRYAASECGSRGCSCEPAHVCLTCLQPFGGGRVLVCIHLFVLHFSVMYGGGLAGIVAMVAVTWSLQLTFELFVPVTTLGSFSMEERIEVRTYVRGLTGVVSTGDGS